MIGGDASISHPFFSAVSLLQSAKRHYALEEKTYAKLLDAYLQPWCEYGSQEYLNEAFKVAEILGKIVFCLSFSRIYACSGIEKFPEFNGYVARSLRDLILLELVI